MSDLLNRNAPTGSPVLYSGDGGILRVDGTGEAVALKGTARGQILVWNHITQVWELGDGAGIVQNSFRDRFVGGAISVSGTNANANVGEMAWNTVHDFSNGTVARVPSVPGHIGIVRLTSNASNGRQGIYLGNAVSNGSMIALDDMASTRWVVRAVNQRCRFGFGDNTQDASLGNNSFFVQASPNTLANWSFNTRKAGVSTLVDTLLPIDPNQWVEWEIQREPVTGALTVLADGEEIVSVTDPAVLPDVANIGPGLQVIQVSGASVAEIDTFELFLV